MPEISLINRLKSRLSPRCFAHTMLALSALWFLGIYPGMNLLCPEHLPKVMVSDPNFGDYGQYYAGAVVAKNGMWSSLYPTPNKEVYERAPDFQPFFKTSLFNEKDRSYCFYPHFYLEASDYTPELLAKCPRLRDLCKYMYPPPLALLLQPLAYIDFEIGARIWTVAIIASLFGVSFFSSRIFRLLTQRVSYAEGLIIGAVMLYSYRGQTSIPPGNVTPILSLLETIAVFAVLKNQQVRLALSMVVLVLFKGIGLTWCPFLLLGRVRWKTILALGIIAAIANGFLIGIAGFGLYRQYFCDVLPRIHVPVGQGLVALVFTAFGYYPSKIYLVLNLAGLAALYLGYWKSARGKSLSEAAPYLVAAIAGAMALFCLLNFTVWNAYYPCYLYFPFLGWLLWERTQAVGRWNTVVSAGIAMGLVLVACEWIVKGLLYHAFGEPAVSVYHLFHVSLTIVGLPVFFLAVALRRLFRAPLPGQNGVLETSGPSGAKLIA